MSKRTELEKKLAKVHHGYTDSVAGLPLKDLEENLLMYAKHREEILVAKEESKEIKEAKNALAELTGPYNDQLNAIKLKSAYVHLLIQDKKVDGKPESESEEE